MSIKPEDLQHPERGLELVTRRGGKAGGRSAGKEAEGPELELDDELEQLRARLQVAESLKKLPDTQPHCGDCFRRGWTAALRAVRGDKGP
jgi:hypothetical protein